MKSINHSRQSLAAYRAVDAETRVPVANAHQLVAMLFDELKRNIGLAREALSCGDIAAKGRAIGKSVRVLEEGLKASLDIRNGGPLAAQLRLLYDGVILRLTQANLRNDERLLDEADRLIEPVRDAWRQIGMQAGATAPGQV
ncbi:MAG: flagellar export chaperone FliS [Betaproteobacteria bacterium]|nr:flagellar export chaperone FliS [Betaproteobacteria bacterium]NBS46973.1 flagellar export chaperone FliS [Betaproteobacteria bacterium]